MQAAYYQARIAEFAAADPAAVLGILTHHHGFALEHQQRGAWETQITLLQNALTDRIEGHIMFEFAIPRMGKRADVVLLIDGVVLVLEFKVGSETFDRHAIEQVHDYALDLKNFHKGSHDLPIIPVVISTAASSSGATTPDFASDQVSKPLLLAASALPDLIGLCDDITPEPIDVTAWLRSGYKPTPTIVQAAQALYQNHAVEEIARSDASAQNLSQTTDSISAVIDAAKKNGRKAICFVTGVPGAGKTLAGLNIATKRAQEHSDEHAVFLSGNGPLVLVLREALARDEAKRDGTTKGAAHRKVSSFIQNIHHFRDEALRSNDAPPERVVVFDEAQRAWTREQASKFMRTKKNYPGFNMSEPEFLISVMDRHADWCVIVCLIGGGQEINTGEAGLGEWLSALGERFNAWDVYISDRLADGDYVADASAAGLLARLPKVKSPQLHLSVSMRSFRAESLSSFIGHIVENRQQEARHVYQQVAERYPLWITRDLGKARTWLQAQARGSERFGLIASSGAHRLKPEGLHVKAKVEPETWFLNDRSDVRSSFYMEEVATEFDIQGLELDWAGVCWDGDFRYVDGNWNCNKFKGTRWQRVVQEEAKLYLKNAYRVILTRARQGMVIFVPQGDAQDPTRPPSFYDQTFRFLQSCGLRELVSPSAEGSSLFPFQTIPRIPVLLNTLADPRFRHGN